MSFEIKGLKKAQQRLNKLQKDAEDLDGQNVPITEILIDEFIAKHSKYASFDELVTASGFKGNPQDEFDSIPDEEWDKFVHQNTEF